MTQFGDLIKSKVPVLIEFYKNTENYADVLADVAKEMKDKVTVLQMDMNENHQLAEALKIGDKHTLVIYKNEKMQWRTTADMNAMQLITVLQEYI